MALVDDYSATLLLAMYLLFAVVEEISVCAAVNECCVCVVAGSSVVY